MVSSTVFKHPFAIGICTFFQEMLYYSEIALGNCSDQYRPSGLIFFC